MTALNFATVQALSRTVICVARNYAAHAKELNNAVPRVIPPIFLKPPSTIVPNGTPIAVPRGATVDHEIELGVVIGRGGARRVAVEDARKCISGYFLGIDVTARDVQRRATKAGMPWTVAKGFETFAVVSEIVPAHKVRDPGNLRLWLRNNGSPRHDGTTRDMIFSVEEVVSFVSNVFPLLEHDIVFTGTPAGVARIDPGDELTAALEDSSTGVILAELRNPVVASDNMHPADVLYRDPTRAKQHAHEREALNNENVKEPTR